MSMRRKELRLNCSIGEWHPLISLFFTRQLLDHVGRIQIIDPHPPQFRSRNVPDGGVIHVHVTVQRLPALLNAASPRFVDDIGSYIDLPLVIVAFVQTDFFHHAAVQSSMKMHLIIPIHRHDQLPFEIPV